LDLSRGKLAKTALWQRGSQAEFRRWFFIRWIYTIKLLLCLLFDRYRPDSPHSDLEGIAHIGKSRILWHPDDRVHHWTELAVGKGLFCNWYYDIFVNYTREGDIPPDHPRILENI